MDGYDTHIRGEVFLATKVWTRGKAEGIAQMERSLALLRTEMIDLMQVHTPLHSPRLEGPGPHQVPWGYTLYGERL